VIAFVTSLRHPSNSADYERVESLLAETLRSVCAQDSDDFIVIIVGNKRPDFELPPHVHFIGVDFPAPVAHAGPHPDLKSFVWDKGTKIGLGLIAAREFQPDYVMIFDADDYVSRRLTSYAGAHAGEPGWVIDRGWIYSHSAGVYRNVEGFNRTCGTCHIVRFDAYAVPANLTLKATQEQIAEAYGERLARILGAHRDARAWLAENGWNLAALPFRGAVYNVDTGENHSGKALTGLARPAAARFEREFGVVAAGTPGSRLAAAMGPRAFIDTAKRVVRRIAKRHPTAQAS
jgi:hypothetical protein